VRAVDVLTEIYRLHSEGRTDAALDLIFTTIEADLKGRGGSMTNDLLVQVDVDRLDEDILVGLLIATYAARSLLKERPHFLERARGRLRLQLGEAVTISVLEDLT